MQNIFPENNIVGKAKLDRGILGSPDWQAAKEQHNYEAARRIVAGQWSSKKTEQLRSFFEDPSNVIFISQPTSSGNNILPIVFAEKLSVDFDTSYVVGDKFFSCLHQQQSKHISKYQRPFNRRKYRTENIEDLRCLVGNKDVVVVEDVLTTGGSVAQFVRSLSEETIKVKSVVALMGDRRLNIDFKTLNRLSESLNKADIPISAHELSEELTRTEAGTIIVTANNVRSANAKQNLTRKLQGILDQSPYKNLGRDQNSGRHKGPGISDISHEATTERISPGHILGIGRTEEGAVAKPIEKYIQGELGLAFGSKEQADEAIESVAKEVNKVSRRGVQDRGGVTKSKIANELRTKRRVDLTGRKLAKGKESQEIAELFQVYRSHKIEILHSIYTAKDGTVLGHNAITSGDMSSVRPKDIAQYIYQMKSAAERLGAEKVHILHNHPSGNPTMSRHDVALAARLYAKPTPEKNALGDLMGEFVVINHGKFTWISEYERDKKGEAYIVPAEGTYEIASSAGEWMEKKGPKFANPGDVAAFGRNLAYDKSRACFVFVDTSNRMQAWSTHDKIILEKSGPELEKILCQQAKGHNAGKVIILADDMTLLEPIAQYGNVGGWLLDALDIKGNSLRSAIPEAFKNSIKPAKPAWGLFEPGAEYGEKPKNQVSELTGKPFISFFSGQELNTTGNINLELQTSRGATGGVVRFENATEKSLEEKTKINPEKIRAAGIDGVILTENGKPVAAIATNKNQLYPNMYQAAKNTTRHYLNVPYEEKDQAQKFGAVWDKMGRSWYIPDGLDQKPFSGWQPGQSIAADNPQQQFAEFIREMGGDLQGHAPDMDGKMHRIPEAGAKHGNKNIAYVGYLDGVPAGWVKNFRGEERRWKMSGVVLTNEDRARLEKEGQEKRTQRTKEWQELYVVKAKESQGITDKLVPATGKEKYFADKGIEIKDPGVKINPKGNIVVPLLDVEGKQWSHQTLQTNGFKQIFKDSKIQGTLALVGAKLVQDIKGDILIAEGYSTAATIHEVTGKPVIVSTTSNNLKHVAQALNERYPDRPIYIMADDDRYLTAQGKINTGQVKAREAAKAVGGHIISPDFDGANPDRTRTDFNDMARVQGKDSVRDYIAAKVELARNPHKNPGKDQGPGMHKGNGNRSREVNPIEIKEILMEAMNETKDCKSVVPMLSAYLDGELLNDDHVKVEKHLQTCHLCRQLVSELELTGSFAKDTLSREAPPVPDLAREWKEIEARAFPSQEQVITKSAEKHPGSVFSVERTGGLKEANDFEISVKEKSGKTHTKQIFVNPKLVSRNDLTDYLKKKEKIFVSDLGIGKHNISERKIRPVEVKIIHANNIEMEMSR